MATVRAITGPALASGFRLAGLTVDEVSDAREAAVRLERLAALPDTGVVLVEQDWFDALPDALRRSLERRPVPIVVPIPRVSWVADRGRAEAYILDLLQRAIGYRVRLQ